MIVVIAPNSNNSHGIGGSGGGGGGGCSADPSCSSPPPHRRPSSSSGAANFSPVEELLRREGVPSDYVESAAVECRMAHDKWWGAGGIARWLEDRKKVFEGDDAEKRPYEGKSWREASAAPEHSSAGIVPPPAAAADPAATARMTASAKADALAHLRASRGDTTNPRFLAALRALTSIYRVTGLDARRRVGRVDREGLYLDGGWTILSRPSFPGCLGTNTRGEFMYGLGRMSFDMFRPTNLRCSIRSIRTEIAAVDQREDLPESVPASLRREVEMYGAGSSEGQGEGEDEPRKPRLNRSVLRTYNIVINFTIEPRDSSSGSGDDDGPDPADPSAPAPSCPLHATMTNSGYMLSDPDKPNRLTVWFTGGELAPRSRSEGGGGSSSSSSSSSLRKQQQRRPRGQASSASSSLPPTAECAPAAAPECPLTLHDCRRESEFCLLHGVGTRRKPVGLPSNASLQWEDIFGPEDNWKRTLGEKAKALAAKVILGAEVPRRMEEDGTMRFSLHRPVGGHGSTFLDVLYLDRDLSITRGNAGTVFVQARCSSTHPTDAAGSFVPGMTGDDVGTGRPRKPMKRSVGTRRTGRTGAVRKAAAA